MTRTRPRTDKLPQEQQDLVAAIQEASRKPWYKDARTIIAGASVLIALGAWVLRAEFQTVAAARAAQEVNLSEHKEITELVSEVVEPIRVNATDIMLNKKDIEHNNAALDKLERRLSRVERAVRGR